MSKAFIIFNMSADFQALGESSDLSVLWTILKPNHV
jgi:hypothetical protein